MSYTDDSGTKLLVLPFYQWCDRTAVGQYVRSTTWCFPLTETIHIMALAVMLGCLFLIDLRLMGVPLGSLTPSRMWKELRGYFLVSLLIILVTGVVLFVSEALKTYDNDAFRPKMVFLATAILFHFTIHQRALTSEQTPRWGKAAGAMSLFLWFSVGAAGRAIGFV